MKPNGSVKRVLRKYINSLSLPQYVHIARIRLYIATYDDRKIISTQIDNKLQSDLKNH